MENQNQDLFSYTAPGVQELFDQLTKGKSEEFKYAVFMSERILAAANVIKFVNDVRIVAALDNTLSHIIEVYIYNFKLDTEEVLSAAGQVAKATRDHAYKIAEAEQQASLTIPPGTTLQ